MKKAIMLGLALAGLMTMAYADEQPFDPANNPAICTPTDITWVYYTCPPENPGSVTWDPITWVPPSKKVCKGEEMSASTAAHPANGWRSRSGWDNCGFPKDGVQSFTPTLLGDGWYNYTISGPVIPDFTASGSGLAASIVTSHTGAGAIDFHQRWQDICDNVFTADVTDVFWVYWVEFVKDKYLGCTEEISHYNAQENLTAETYDRSQLVWTGGGDMVIVNPSSGDITYSTKQGNYPITARFVDLPCTDTFTLHLLKLILAKEYLGINLEDGAAGHDSMGAWVDPDLSGVGYAWQPIAGSAHCVYDPTNPGNVASTTIKETGEASGGYLGEEARVNVTPPNGDPSFILSSNFTVVKVDITVANMAETNEETQGVNVPYNNDDDNAAVIADKLDYSENGEVVNEDDLLEVLVDVKPLLPATDVITLSGNLLDLYEDPLKKTPAATTYPANSFPRYFYINGREPSGNLRDLWIEAKHDASPAKDKINYTTFMVDIKGPDFFENTAIDDHVEEYSANSWGRYVELNDDDDAPALGNDEWDFNDSLTDRGQDERLVALPLELKPGMRAGDTLELKWVGDIISVYSGPKANLTPVASGRLFQSTNLPTQLWIEGKAASGSMKDVEMTATYTRNPGKPSIDKVKLTVCSVDVDGDSNGDGAIDEYGDTDDKLEGDDRYPVYVLLNDDDSNDDGIIDNSNSVVDGDEDLAQMADLEVREVLPIDIPQGTVKLEDADHVRIFGQINGNWVVVKGASGDGVQPVDLWPYLPMNLKVEGVAFGNEPLTIRYKHGTTELTDKLYLKVLKIGSETVATIPYNRSRTKIGVAEQVNLTATPAIDGMTWSTTSGSLSPTNGESTTFTAPETVGNVVVSLHISGSTFKKTFLVFQPDTVVHAEIASTVSMPVESPGAGMHLAPVIVGPTNVSFYRLEIVEVGEDASTITGYFTFNSPPSHIGHGADEWFPLNEDNSWPTDWDWAVLGSADCPPPWLAGGFMWNIPAKWRVGSTGTEHSMTGWNQAFSIQANGTASVQKFGHSVTRTTNDVSTTY